MTNSGPSQNDIFDVKKVRRLVELMKEYDLAEVDLKQGDQRVRLRRGPEAFAVMSGSSNPVATLGSMAPSPAPSSSAAKVPPPPEDDVNTILIKSPMVGTFYTKPNPESPNFVKVGDHVGPDTIVCIIEAMKVFNQIPAEVSGQVTAILVENGQPVEFGQPLYKLAAK